MAQFRDEALLKKIIAKLKELRVSKGLTHEEVYNDIDVHIGRVESTKSNITVSTLAKLCKYYEISLTDFFKNIS